MNMIPQSKDDQVIEAYNLLCVNLYIESAVAVIEESFSMLLMLADPDVKGCAGLSDDQLELVGRENREFLMKIIDDPDGLLLPEAIRQYMDDKAAFRENVRYRSILRGASLRELNGREQQGDHQVG